MNKQTVEFSSALGDMDDALVSEAARASKVKKSRRPLIIAAASLLVLAALAAIALPKLLKNDTAEVSALAVETEPAEPTEEPAPAEPDDGAKANAPVPVPDAHVEPFPEPTDTPEPAPDFPPEPVISVTDGLFKHTEGSLAFGSVVALNMAVRSDWSDELSGLDGIYMPTKVPYGAQLADITVTDDKVALLYEITGEYYRDDIPNVFVFVWFRNWSKGSAKSYAESLFSDFAAGSEFGALDAELICVDGVWMFNCNGNDERIGIWESGGKGFEIVIPGNYPEIEDMLGFANAVFVELGGVEVHTPSEGFVIDGYMWLSENGFGAVPVNSFAYSTAYCVSESGEGSLIRTEGEDFVGSIPMEMRTYEKMMKAYPHVGSAAEPVLLEDAVIVEINVYNGITLEAIALDISLDELRDIMKLNVDEALLNYVTEDSRGSILVDIVVAHRLNYISALDDYEVDACHCAFIVDCG